MNWKTYLIAQALSVAAFNTLCNSAYPQQHASL